MNEFGTSYGNTVFNRIEMTEAMVKDLKKELEWFRQNENACFTTYDHNAIDYSMKKTDEAIECLHQSLLSIRMLLG